MLTTGKFWKDFKKLFNVIADDVRMSSNRIKGAIKMSEKRGNTGTTEEAIFVDCFREFIEKTTRNKQV